MGWYCCINDDTVSLVIFHVDICDVHEGVLKSFVTLNFISLEETLLLLGHINQL